MESIFTHKEGEIILETMELWRTDCGVLSDILWIKRGQCMN